MDSRYLVIRKTPDIDDYLRLRIAAGLTPRSREAATAGLPNTIAGVVVESDRGIVGMGRVIGDGGLAFQIVDIAVDPDHQGQGLGKAIVAELMDALKQIIPAEAYVSLIADGEAHKLYARYGFNLTAPASVGMAMWLR